MKWLLRVVACLFISTTALAGDYGFLQLSVNQVNSNHRTSVKIKLSGKAFSSISHSQSSPIKLSITSDFLAKGPSTQLSSDYGGLEEGCQFDFVINYSLDGNQWIPLGSYTAPSRAVSGAIPIGLCDGEICSNNADITRKLEAIHQKKWKAAGEAIKKWLDDAMKREAQELATERAKLEAQKAPEPNESNLQAEIDALTEDVASQEMIELEQPTLEDPNKVLEDRITNALNAGSVDGLIDQLSVEEKFYQSCIAGSSATQHYCQQYGGMGWMVAGAETISAALAADPDAAMQKLYTRISGHSPGSSLQDRLQALADFRFKIQTAKDAKRASDMMSNFADAARVGVGFTPVGDVIDLCEAITGREFCYPQGKELSPGQRFLSILGTLITNRTTLEAIGPISDELKAAIKGAFDNPEPLEKAINKIVKHSDDFDPKGITHTLFGDFAERDGITKIQGGMHTEDAVNALMERWEKQGVQFNVTNADTLADIPSPFSLDRTLIRYEDPSGVIVYKMPWDLYSNNKARASTVVVYIDGVKKEILGAKTLYPQSWTTETIVDSWIAIKNPKNIVREQGGQIMYKGTYQGIPITVWADKNGALTTGYPTL